MSKKNKRKQEEPNQPKKGFKGQTLDIADSDPTQYVCLLSEDYVNNGNLKLAQKVLSDYKYLLEATTQQFWATLRYSVTLQDTLDMFLRYAPRSHLLIKPLDLHGYYGTILKEIYRSVLAIYLRIADLQQEDSILAEQIDYQRLIYDQWILDVLKLTDLASIYAQENSSAISKIAKFVFSFQAYHDDFITTISTFEDQILSRLFRDICNTNNKSFQENEIFINDVEDKMEILTIMLESIETLIIWAKYFPQKHVIFHPVKIVPIVEQLFYEFLIAKGYERGKLVVPGAWKLSKMPVNINPYMELALQRIIDYFVMYFNYIQDLTLQNQNKQLQDHMSYLVQSFGLLRRKQKNKKNQNINDIKEWTLMEGISESGFSVLDFLSSVVPWDTININKQQVEDVLVQMAANMSERDSIKDKLKQGHIEVEELVESDYQNLDIKNTNLVDAVSDEEVVEEEVEQEPVEYEKQIETSENLIALVPRKKQQSNLEMSQSEKQKLIEITMKMYNDEPDDTFDYQEGMQRPEKGQNNNKQHDDDYEISTGQLQFSRQNSKVLTKPRGGQPQQQRQSFQDLDGGSQDRQQRQQQVQGVRDDFNQGNNSSYNQSSYNQYNNNSKYPKDNDYRRDQGNTYNNYQQQHQQQQPTGHKVLQKDRDGGYVTKQNKQQGQNNKGKQQQSNQNTQSNSDNFEKQNNKQHPQQQQQQHNQSNKSNNNNRNQNQKPLNRHAAEYTPKVQEEKEKTTTEDKNKKTAKYSNQTCEYQQK